jgi:hypothetical protein
MQHDKPPKPQNQMCQHQLCEASSSGCPSVVAAVLEDGDVCFAQRDGFHATAIALTGVAPGHGTPDDLDVRELAHCLGERGAVAMDPAG